MKSNESKKFILSVLKIGIIFTAIYTGFSSPSLLKRRSKMRLRCRLGDEF